MFSEKLLAAMSITVLVIEYGGLNHLYYPGPVKRMIDDSKHKLALVESKSIALRLTKQEVQSAIKYINAHKDYSSFHLLMVVQKQSPTHYANLPRDTKAAILSSALANIRCLNDWGYLHPREPYDGDVARALVDIGRPAILHLLPLLDDSSPALLFGSEASTLSIRYKFRRADYACRYISQIIGQPAIFHPDISQRNKKIIALKKRLTAEKTKRKK
jgi:hypothetical protein